MTIVMKSASTGRSLAGGRWTSALVAAAALAVPARSWAQCDGPELTLAELVTPDAGSSAEYGSAVSVFGEAAIVGAYKDDDLGTYSGSAHVFTVADGQWTDPQQLLASDGSPYSRFGFSVDILDGIAIVGAPMALDDGEATGAAYVFEHDGEGWSERVKLLGGEPLSTFGRSVSITGDYVFVGSFDGELGYNAGAVFVYRRQFDPVEQTWQWGFHQKLLATDGVASQLFGDSVQARGDVAVVGASGDFAEGGYTGAAYVFRLVGDQWLEEQKLQASDPAALAEFGRSVAIEDDVIVIGAPNAGNPGTGLPVGAGAAYVFEHGGETWTETARLEDAEGAVQDKFGHAVAVTGGTVFVGAPSDDDAGSQTGSVFVYGRQGGTWGEQLHLLPPEDSGYKFGYALGGFAGSAALGAQFGSAFVASSGGQASTTR
ncbi:MAG: FG-GAP repeat protein [Planctomycetota bacterium]|jgi:hypothetical protein